MSTRSLEVRFVGDASQLNRTFAQVNRGAAGLDQGATKGASALGKMSRAAAGLGVGLGAAGLARFAFDAANAAGDLGEAVSKNDQVFKASAAEVEAWSQTTADGIGISQQAALDATGTFGNMLVPMGIARDKAADLSIGMTDLAGDLASFNNADPSEVLEALRSGLAGETEPLRRFGIFLNAARVEQEALNLGLAEQGEELTSAAKAQATYSIIMQDTADAQGDFERTSGSAANQQRILAAEWQNAQAALGQALLPALVATAQALREGIEFAREHGDTIQDVAVAVAAGAAAWGLYRTALVGVHATEALTKANALELLNVLKLNPAALAAAAAAAVVVGGAYVLLRDKASWAEETLDDVAEASRRAADAHQAVADAVDAQKAALDRLNGSNLDVEGAQLRVEQASRRAAEAEKEYGKDSLEARQARHDLAQAEQAVGEARRRNIEDAKKGVELTRASSAEIDKEVRSTQTRLTLARQNAQLFRGNSEVQRELMAASRAAGNASATAAEKHRDNAQRALEMARETGGATKQAREARAELRRLAQQEFSLAAHVQALNAVTTALSSVEAGYQNVVMWMERAANAPTIPTPGIPRPGGRGGAGGRPRGQNADARKGSNTFESPYQEDAKGPASLDFMLGKPPAGSPVSLDRIRARGDRQARTGRIEGENAARKQGKTASEISREGERRATNAQITATKKVISAIEKRRPKLVAIAKANALGKRIKAHPITGTDAQKAKAEAGRAKMKEKHDRAREELRSIARDYADAKVVLEELGETIKDLRRDDEAEDAADAQEAADAAAEAAADQPTQADYLDAAVAQAALTADPADDIAAADAVALAAGHAYNAAVASGDRRRIADAARALKQAQDNAANLRATQDNTAAIKENTEVQKQQMNGSVAFGFRGQTEVLRSLAPSSDRLEAFV